MPEDTVYVGRGSKWGNPHSFAGSLNTNSADVLDALQHVVNLYEYHVEDRQNEIKRELRDKNLAC
jgi:hypothetical protein